MLDDSFSCVQTLMVPGEVLIPNLGQTDLQPSDMIIRPLLVLVRVSDESTEIGSDFDHILANNLRNRHLTHPSAAV
jgi:hypothetical protein